MCRNINYICNKNNIDKYIHNTSQLNSIYELAEPSSRGATIGSFLMYGNSLPYDSDYYHNISEIITSYVRNDRYAYHISTSTLLYSVDDCMSVYCQVTLLSSFCKPVLVLCVRINIIILINIHSIYLYINYTYFNAFDIFATFVAEIHTKTERRSTYQDASKTDQQQQ